MYKDKLDGAVSDEDYTLFRQSLGNEEQQLSEQIAETIRRIDECRKHQEYAEGLKALIEKYTHFDKLNRTITEEFIDFIEIGMIDEKRGREIHIHWKL